MGIDVVTLDDGSRRQIDEITGNTVEYADSTTRLIATKVASITRTNTTDTNLFTLPKNAVPVSAWWYSAVASNAGSGATLNVGITGTDTAFFTADVKGTSGQQRPTTVGSLMTAISTSTVTQVVAKYTETGSASNTGGPFFVAIDFYVT